MNHTAAPASTYSLGYFFNTGTGSEEKSMDILAADGKQKPPMPFHVFVGNNLGAFDICTDEQEGDEPNPDFILSGHAHPPHDCANATHDSVWEMTNAVLEELVPALDILRAHFKFKDQFLIDSLLEFARKTPTFFTSYLADHGVPTSGLAPDLRITFEPDDFGGLVVSAIIDIAEEEDSDAVFEEQRKLEEGDDYVPPEDDDVSGGMMAEAEYQIAALVINLRNTEVNHDN